MHEEKILITCNSSDENDDMMHSSKENNTKEIFTQNTGEINLSKHAYQNKKCVKAIY